MSSSSENRMYQQPLSGNEVNPLFLLRRSQMPKAPELYSVFNEIVSPSWVSDLHRIQVQERPAVAAHAQRVALVAYTFAQRVGLSKESSLLFARAGLLHDIGKVYTKKAILDKTDELTPQEYAEMQQHVLSGVSMLMQEAKINPQAKFIAAIIAGHHWYNPGDRISYPSVDSIRMLIPDYDDLISRHPQIKWLQIMLALIDQSDALRSARAYKIALTIEKVAEIFRKEGVFPLFFVNLVLNLRDKVI